MVEASRYQQAKRQIDEASINSALSLLASYDSGLASRFGLYGMNSEKMKSDAFLNYLQFNSDNIATGTYSSNNLSQLYNVTGGTYTLSYDLANYAVLQRQMLEYTKYRAPLNMASELLDIDKMIKELKKNIEKAIPGLKQILEVLNAIADIVEAIKALYCLYKDIQQLQLSLGYVDSLGDVVNDVAGKGWEMVEGLLGGKKWPSHNPTYKQAYNDFKTAVNNKVNYMKNNPKPPDPGPKPTSDVSGLEASYKTAKTKYETASLLADLLDAAEELGYFDSQGIVDSTSKIDDLLDQDITEDDLKKLNLTKNSTRSALMSAINGKVSSVLSSSNQLSSYTSGDVAGLSGALDGVIPGLSSDMSTKYSKYYTAKAEHDEWNRKYQALKKYNEDIEGYNKEINSKKSQFKGVVDVIAGELKDYKSSLSGICDALDSATAAMGKLKEMGEKDKNGKDKEVDSYSVFDTIKREYIQPELDKPDDGIEFLRGQKETLEALKAEDIDASYKFSSHFSEGDLNKDDVYFMSKTQATGFCTLLAGINLLEDAAEVVKMLEALWDLVEILQPLPYAYTPDCVVELNSQTTSILPSKINGGNGTFAVSNQDDIDAISAMLDEAKALLGGNYTGDINAVSPSNRLPDSELEEELTHRIMRLGDNLGKVLASNAAASLLASPAWWFIATVLTLATLAPTLIEIVDDLIFIAENFGLAFEIIVSSLGDGVLLNEYAVEKFPNRLTTDEVSGYGGDTRQLNPDNLKSRQTFSSAQVEYIIGGDYSEIVNQRRCFWSLFAIRAINNIFCVIGTPDVMEIIGACNIAAPLVFIAWVYLESNVDMNIMLKGHELPLIKLQLILSKDGLTDIADSVKNTFKDADKENFGKDELGYAAMRTDYLVEELTKNVDGIFKMEYKDYLWFFLFLVPNRTKVMRMADLIQMEMRFKDQYNNFLMKNLYTYVRCEVRGEFNSILPILSLNNNSLNGRGFEVSCVKYVGY